MSFFSLLLQPLLSQEPAPRLIRKTARDQWRLIVVSLVSNLLGAVIEGATLGLVFLSVEVLSGSEGTPYSESFASVFDVVPGVATWLSPLPATWVFLVILGCAVLLQLLQSFTAYLNALSIGYFSARCKSLVTARIHSQVLSLSFPCASNYKVGDLTDHANLGPQAIRLQIEQLSSLLVGSLLCITYILVLVRISPLLLISVLLIGATLTLIQKRLLPKIRSGSLAVSSGELVINTRITEDFQGLRLLHSTGQLEEAAGRVESFMGELEKLLRAQARRLAVVGPVAGALPVISIALIASVSVLVLGGKSNGFLPSLVTFVLALQRLNGRFSIINANLNQLADNSGRFHRINEILSKEDKRFRRVGGTPFVNLNNSVSFVRVSLHYNPNLPPALKDISFTLPKGKMLALVGSSGAGKSSIADLLTGLFIPTKGHIMIDGVPLDQLDLSSWQQRLGVVSQDTFLFNATISENIAFGSPHASRQKIEAASRAAQAADFIESLPDGYETLVGERGYRISGGQRQRLSLARAILRDPEVLILDEATSALDSESERLVQDAIDRFERSHTVLVIAHRLSTITRADQILVLDNGRVVQHGTHKDLVNISGIYSRLWSLQENR